MDLIKASQSFIEAKIASLIDDPPRPLATARKQLRWWKEARKLAIATPHPEFPNWFPVKIDAMKACLKTIQHEIEQLVPPEFN